MGPIGRVNPNVVGTPCPDFFDLVVADDFEPNRICLGDVLYQRAEGNRAVVRLVGGPYHGHHGRNRRCRYHQSACC